MMLQHLIDMFRFNMDANLKMVSSVEEIPENAEMIKHLSHLATCQYKWLGRIIPTPESEHVNWWEPIYTLDDLRHHLKSSSERWIDYFKSLQESDLANIVQYDLGKNRIAEVTVQDIGHQLVFHSFHHRAQIQLMIRAKGFQPKFIEYIGSRINKKGES